MKMIGYLERIFLWLIFCFTLHSLLLFVWDTKEGKESEALIKSIVRTTQFGAHLENAEATNYVAWFPLYQRRTEVPLIVTLGESRYRVGTWYEHRLGWSRKVILRQEAEPSSFFVHPNRAEKKGLQETADEWTRILDAPSQAVGRIAVSTRHPVSPSGLLDMLAPYGVSVEWMSVYHEEEQGEYPLLGIGPPEKGEARELTEGNLPESLYLFQQDVAELRRNEKEVVAWLGSDLNLAEREKRLDRQSIQVYGAILTGRMEQLASLRQLLQLHSPYLLITQLNPYPLPKISKKHFHIMNL